MSRAVVDQSDWKQLHLTGSCLCGGVSYEIDGLVRPVINCFCSQCRKTSGHYVAATCVDKNHLSVNSDETLEWFECLPDIFRGFCKTCGSSLFWDAGKENRISIMAGTLDPPTHLETIENIYLEDASDYCRIPDVGGD